MENGERDRGLALLTEATDALRATQSLAWLSYLLGLLSDARIKAGQPSEAMKAVEEAISLVETTGERFYSAELYRLRGELLAQVSIGQCEKPKLNLTGPSRSLRNRALFPWSAKRETACAACLVSDTSRADAKVVASATF